MDNSRSDRGRVPRGQFLLALAAILCGAIMVVRELTDEAAVLGLVAGAVLMIGGGLSLARTLRTSRT